MVRRPDGRVFSGGKAVTDVVGNAGIGTVEAGAKLKTGINDFIDGRVENARIGAYGGRGASMGAIDDSVVEGERRIQELGNAMTSVGDVGWRVQPINSDSRRSQRAQSQQERESASDDYEVG